MCVCVSLPLPPPTPSPPPSLLCLSPLARPPSLPLSLSHSLHSRALSRPPPASLPLPLPRPPSLPPSLPAPRGGSTQTAQALQYLLRKGFPGGRNSSGVAQVAVLLSDGRSQEGFSKGGLVQAASQLKESGVVLFAVGLRHPR